MGRIPTWRIPKPRTECDMSDTVDEDSEEEEIPIKEPDPGSIAFSFLKSGMFKTDCAKNIIEGIFFRKIQ